MKNFNLSSQTKDLKSLSIAIVVLSLLLWILFFIARLIIFSSAFAEIFWFIGAALWIGNFVVTIIASVRSYQLKQETVSRVLSSKFQLLFILFLIGIFINIVAFIGAIIYLASVDKMIQEENKYFAPDNSDLDQKA
ncbi:hypothetical protein [Mycoplasmopsis columboralis]|uniref:Uncharacterized protein n=1 Tax=Mycoplasmopsis columboralis TaxID=171282 RepID=A0A449B749_9BACT|nr:hypothetical protein [Mycoplasmopsis columboralis]VEU76408.1 Uncharacterised protein [Mycoplasmopsis columboralis]